MTDILNKLGLDANGERVLSKEAANADMEAMFATLEAQAKTDDDRDFIMLSKALTFPVVRYVETVFERAHATDGGKMDATKIVNTLAAAMARAAMQFVVNARDPEVAEALVIHAKAFTGNHGLTAADAPRILGGYVSTAFDNQLRHSVENLIIGRAVSTTVDHRKKK